MISISINHVSETSNDLKPDWLARHVTTPALVFLATETLALLGIVYHVAATVTLALPASMRLFSNRIPESLSWAHLYEDHVARAGLCVKMALCAPSKVAKAAELSKSVQKVSNAVFAKKIATRPALPIVLAPLTPPTSIKVPVPPTPAPAKSLLGEGWRFVKAHKGVLIAGAATAVVIGLGIMKIGQMMEEARITRVLDEARDFCKMAGGTTNKRPGPWLNSFECNVSETKFTDISNLSHPSAEAQNGELSAFFKWIKELPDIFKNSTCGQYDRVNADYYEGAPHVRCEYDHAADIAAKMKF